jgi:hypothetical protein
MTRKIALIEVFNEFKPVLESYSRVEDYRVKREVIEVEDKPKLTKEVLEEHVKKLMEKYPQRGFKIVEKKIGEKTFIVLDQYYKTPEGKRKKDRIPIYFDLESQKAFIPSSFIKTKKRLASYIVLRTLGALGWARVGRVVE